MNTNPSQARRADERRAGVCGVTYHGRTSSRPHRAALKESPSVYMPVEGDATPRRFRGELRISQGGVRLSMRSTVAEISCAQAFERRSIVAHDVGVE